MSDITKKAELEIQYYLKLLNAPKKPFLMLGKLVQEISSLQEEVERLRSEALEDATTGIENHTTRRNQEKFLKYRLQSEDKIQSLQSQLAAVGGGK